MIVLDTNVISECMRVQPNVSVMRWIHNQPTTELFTTSISIAEIQYGIRRLPSGKKQRDLLQRFNAFLSFGFTNRILVFDSNAAERYGVIVSLREASGTPINAFDAMIASIAAVHHASIATRDESGFSACELTVLNPWTA